MTTFPNTVLLRGDPERGEPTILVDPGPAAAERAGAQGARRRGVSTSATWISWRSTHAHDDHACACVDLPLPVALHEAEIGAPALARRGGHPRRPRAARAARVTTGELAPGVRWALTPGHTPGGVTYAVDTADGGPSSLCGDIVGPSRDRFDAMEPEPGPDAGGSPRLVAAHPRARADRVIAGHLPPFAL